MERYITEETHERLKQELLQMKTEGRREIAERIRVAKGFGDLSENAEYSEALDSQRRLEQRIAELEATLKEAVIIKPSKSKVRIEVGVSFEARDLKTKRKYKFTLVGFGDAKPLEGKISSDSPIGRAFLGTNIGDEIEVKLGDRVLRYKVAKIL